MCGCVQFSIPKWLLGKAKNPNHMMELLTERQRPDQRRAFRWGKCKRKKPPCQGVWWTPIGKNDSRNGWMFVQVPNAPKSLTAEDFEE